ncbi:MAG: aspartate kinase [Deltaproteobacteria bacterium]|jgi:aspartate kinase|nr:aspartate kinase [Deltaproteobacteria bacterium]MBT4527186.1 aspartate kinase [Deltaproteobacteria bacterium]
MKISVLKFGGTSMGSVSAISQSAQIVKKASQDSKVMVVVSAISGMTNLLIELIELARKQKQRLIAGRLNKMEEIHRSILKDFVDEEDLDEIWKKEFAPAFKKLRYVLTGISFIGELTDKTYAFICIFGERFSSRIMAYALQKEGMQGLKINAKRVISTDSQYLEANVDFKKTAERTKRIILPLLQKEITPVVMGFSGKDTHGDTTLLGRGGSDYTASILGISLDVSDIQIWTDVDGVMSADPREIKNVQLWSKISLDVMAEMTNSGAKVLHPKTITAAVKKNIPVYIKNTFNPSAEGTLVSGDKRKGLKGVVLVQDQTIINLVNPEMLDAFGFISNCSQQFVDNNVPVDVCATSEVSVTCSIASSDQSNKLNRSLSKIAHVEIHKEKAKLCVIGCDVTQNAELISRIFSVLKNYNIYTVSIGATFHNITILIDNKNSKAALKLLHQELFE